MNLKNHEKALKENVFFTKIKWPHFNLLFKDVNFISRKIKKFYSIKFRKNKFIWQCKLIRSIF